MKYRIIKIAFMAWVVIWMFLVARELFIKDNIRDYKALIGKTLEGKRAYITGESLYEFLGLCKARLPSEATYSLAGLEDGSIEKRRAVYYLYPLLESADPDFVLDYGGQAGAKEGYGVVAEFAGLGRIMKKTGKR